MAESATVETPFGNMEILVVSEREVQLIVPQDSFITINGVNYTGRAYFAKYDGSETFSAYRTYYGGVRYHVGGSVMMHRVDNYNDPSDAAKRKAIAVLTAVVNEFAARNPGMFSSAKLTNLQNAVGHAERDVEELEAQLSEARGRLQEADNALTAFIAESQAR